LVKLISHSALPIANNIIWKFLNSASKIEQIQNQHILKATIGRKKQISHSALPTSNNI